MPQVKVVDLTRRTGQDNIERIKNNREPISAVYDDPSVLADDFAYIRKEVMLRTERAENLKKNIDLENPA
jgi:hypothetical protein